MGELREKYLYSDIEQLLQELFAKCTGKPLHPFAILPMPLMRKIQNSMRSIFLLLEARLVHDSAIILRSMCEATIFLVASTKDETFFSRYADSGYAKRLRLIKARKVISDRFEMRMDKESLDLEKELEKLLYKEPRCFLKKWIRRFRRDKTLKKKYRFIDTPKLAKHYGLQELYHQYFEYGSDPMHNMPNTLEAYVASEDISQAFNLVEYPDLQDEALIMSGALHCLFLAVRHINEYAKCGLNIPIRALENKINQVTGPEMDRFTKSIEDTGNEKESIIGHVRQMNKSGK